MKKMLCAFCALCGFMLLSGCGTLGNGKLEASDVAAAKSAAASVAPLVQGAASLSGNAQLAKAAKVAGAFVPQAPAVETVPAGYTVRWRHFLDGKEIDPSKIVAKPELEPVSEVATLKNQIAPNVPPVPAQHEKTAPKHDAPATSGGTPSSNLGGRSILEELRK